MMKEAILVRHAESFFNVQETQNLDSNLTLRGAHQAKAAADYLEKSKDAEGFQGYVSPFQRTLDTALLIHLKTGIPFKVFPLISEYGATWSTIPYKIHVPYRENSFPMFDWSLYKKKGETFTAETFQQFLDRMQKVLKSHLPEKTLIVSHGAVVYTLIDLLTGGGHLDESYSIVTNASITKLTDKRPVYLFKKDW
jgi:broad specificity phosphatase PhoE